ncbi:hypothetical protein Gohar_005903 [Gossypium harknessii]|uniref:Hydroxyproline-rich glycoprotein family protein n=2 Tax=Gossypium TaxID=3633 RepID=A0A7J9JMK1_9ROSI|nr:hypothetical protein [Gossypium harknessii]MBA0835395.1 hypothetical protein [Gossypium armourianum]
MAEMKAEGHAKKRTIRLPPSVPFLWEVRPGIAKKDWKPEASAISRVLPPPTPIKFIASIPFNWEEKPGTPLPSFLQPAVEPMGVQPSATLMTLPPPPVYSPAYFNGCNSNDDQGDDIEAFGFETDDSFSSASSILENCSLAASTVVSTIVPEQKTYQIDNDSDHPEIPSSPASETDSTSSYATGASSLVGVSFLECLFPLLPPNAGFLEKVRFPDEESQTAQNNFDRESNNTVIIRKPPTLGELIMMSRRRSYQRKAAQIREKNISMEFLKERRAPGCCIFGTGIKIIEGSQLKKFQKRLKFF